MKTSKGIIGQVATCTACGKLWEDYIRSRARNSAYQHAKNTGHEVHVETVSFIKYN